MKVALIIYFLFKSKRLQYCSITTGVYRKCQQYALFPWSLLSLFDSPGRLDVCTFEAIIHFGDGFKPTVSQCNDPNQGILMLRK